MKKIRVDWRNKEHFFLYLPVLLLLPGLIYASKLPENWAYFSDPTYAYLFNGLGILTGHPPNLIQHPGISMEVYVALVILFTSLLTGKTNFVKSVIENPEKYLQSIAYVNLLILLSIFVILSKSIQKRFGVAPLFIFQLSIIACLNLFLPFVLLAMPEFLVLSTSMVCLSIVFRKQNNLQNPKYPMLVCYTLGFFLATGLMAKVIFAPMLIIAFIVAGKQNGRRIIISLALFTSMYLALIPNRIMDMLKWFLASSKSLNRYDAPSSYDSSLFLNNFRTSLINIESLIGPIFVIFIILALLIPIFFFVPSTKSSNPKLLIGSFLTILAIFLTGYKATLGRDFVLIGILLSLTFTLMSVEFQRFQLHKVSILIFFFLLLLSSYSNTDPINQSLNTNIQASATAQNDFRLVQGVIGKSWLVGQYGILSKNAASQFGNNWAGSHFSATLATEYPRQIEFNIWDSNFYYNQPNSVLTILTCENLRSITRNQGVYVLILNNSLTDRSVSENSIVFSNKVKMSYAAQRKFQRYTLFEISSIKCTLS